jgi:5-hydroxyisourate hydrolase-like protein (transthyretin family)
LRPATYELAATAVDGAGNATTSDRRAGGAKAELTAPLRVPMQVRLATRPIITTKQMCRTKRVRNRAGRLVKKRVCRQVAVRPPRPVRSLRIAFGKRRQIFGALTTREGRPLAGAQVILRARAARLGAQTQRVATVKTNSAGRFSYLARGTQSRRLLAIYPGTATVGYAAARANIRVPAKVKLRATPPAVRNGKSTTFTGRLVGGPIPPSKLVALQVIVRGEWRPFRTVRADATGRFRAVYRFALTRTTSRYRFRAAVPREATYPYDTGASRPLNVLVRP